MQRSFATRFVAALLAALLPLTPALAAPAAKHPARLVVLRYVPLSGATEAVAQKASALVRSELQGREELKIVDPPAPRAATHAAALDEKAQEQARSALLKAEALSKKGKHEQAASALAKAIGALQGQPAAIDATGGALLGEATLQLAVARLLAGDEDGGDAALAQLVRLSPERTPSDASYPPAFRREFGLVQRRTLSQARGALRIAGATGLADAKVMLDGRPLREAPVLVRDVLPGEHFVRVQSGDAVWATRVTVLSGQELPLAPQLGAASSAPSAELTAALRLGSLDRATAARAGKIARAASAQAVLLGGLVKEGDGYAARSFAVLAKGDEVVALAPMALDGELLGASLEVLKLADDLTAKLSQPGPFATLPLALGEPGVASADAPALPEVSAAPPRVVASPDLPALPSAPGESSGASPSSAAAATDKALDSTSNAAAPSAPRAAEKAGDSTSSAAAPSAPRAAEKAGDSTSSAAAPSAPATDRAAQPAGVAESRPDAPSRSVAIPGAPTPLPSPSTAAAAPQTTADAAGDARAEKREAPAREADSSRPSATGAERSVVKPGEAVRPGSTSAGSEAAARSPSGGARAEEERVRTRGEDREGEAGQLAAARKQQKVEEGPSKDLVIPRAPTPDDDAPATAAPAPRAVAMAPATRRIEAVEPSALVVPREEARPAEKHHTALWIVAGVLAASALGAGGYLLYNGSRTPSSATVHASWAH